MTFLILFVFLGAATLAMPIAHAILVAAMAAAVSSDRVPFDLLVQQMVAQVQSFPLIAIPFFMLTGSLMMGGKLGQAIVGTLTVLVGRWHGGPAQVSVLSSTLFGGVSGSAVADASAIGSLVMPWHRRLGYPMAFSAASLASAATIDIIIPPSIPMILYGVSAEVSIGELFIAGFGPGLFIGAALMFWVWIYCKYKGWGKNDGEGRLSFGKASWQAGWALMMPVIILGGIYGGVFTPTEASAVAVFYALIVGTLIYREIKLKDLAIIMRKSVLSSAVIMFIIANAGLFAFLITRAGIPDAIGLWLTAVLPKDTEADASFRLKQEEGSRLAQQPLPYSLTE
mgnify:CR=1 FL=1